VAAAKPRQKRVPNSGGNGETSSKADSPNGNNVTPVSEGKWVLVNTQTKLYEEIDDDEKFSGENGKFEAFVTAEGKAAQRPL